jgi:head-tail adaptor
VTARAEALAAAVAIINRSTSDLAELVRCLDSAGQTRLANALRIHLRGRPAEIAGVPKPDIAMWLRGSAR